MRPEVWVEFGRHGHRRGVIVGFVARGKGVSAIVLCGHRLLPVKLADLKVIDPSRKKT